MLPVTTLVMKQMGPYIGISEQPKRFLDTAWVRCAYGAAARLRPAWRPQPFRVCLSGVRPPFLPHAKPTVSDLPNASFLENLRELQGAPESVLNDEDLLQYLMSVPRTDFCLCGEPESTHSQGPHRLHAPLIVPSGEQDDDTQEAEMLLGKDVAAGGFEWHRYSGGHFFTKPFISVTVFARLRKSLDQPDAVEPRSGLRNA